MDMSVTAVACNTSEHAEALLRAWVVGDWDQLERELRTIAGLTGDAETPEEAERLDLLKALGIQLSAHPPASAHGRLDARLELYERLLRNLIVPPPHPGPRILLQ